MSIILFHLSMISFFILKLKIYAAVVVGCILIISIVYICNLHTNYIFKIHDLYSKLREFEDNDTIIQENDVINWR